MLYVQVFLSCLSFNIPLSIGLLAFVGLGLVICVLCAFCISLTLFISLSLIKLIETSAKEGNELYKLTLLLLFLHGLDVSGFYISI